MTDVDAPLARTLGDDRAALAHLGTVVDRVTAADLALPTPCAGWDVHALLDHVVGGNLLYARAASGEAPDWSTRSDDHLGADHRGAYARSSTAVTSDVVPGFRSVIPPFSRLGAPVTVRILQTHSDGSLTRF